MLDRMMAIGREHGCLIVLLALSSGFVFIGLGDRYLWQDEASTAVPARNILKYGYPSLWDGRSVADDPGNFQGFDRYGFYNQHPPLPFYLVAASFAVFGANTLAARLPFALLGLAFIFLMHRFVREVYDDRTVADFTTVFLVTCVPFLLHFRQCRYYTPMLLLTVIALQAYYRFVVHRKSPTPLVIGAVLLYYTFYVPFFAVMAAITGHWLLFHRGQRVREAVGALAVIFCATFPWFMLNRTFGAAIPATYATVTSNLARYLTDANQYFFPFVFLVPVAWSLPGPRRRKILMALLAAGLWAVSLLVFAEFIPRGSSVGWGLLLGVAALAAGWSLHRPGPDKSVTFLLFLVVFFTVVLATVQGAMQGEPHLRYILGAVPMLGVFLGLICRAIRQRWGAAVYAVVALLVLTNAVHLFPYGFLRSVPLPSGALSFLISKTPAAYIAALATGRTIEEARDATQVTRRLAVVEAQIRQTPAVQYVLFDFIGELLDDGYRSPESALARYLNRHGQPGEVVLANYYNPVLIFYTNLRIMFTLDFKEAEEMRPDWLVVLDPPWKPVDWTLMRRVLAGYRTIELDAPAVIWGNIPSITYHYFRTPATEGRMKIYRRAGQ